MFCSKSWQAGIDGVQLVHLTHQGLLGLGVDSEEHVKCLLLPQGLRGGKLRENGYQFMGASNGFVCCLTCEG